MGCPFDIENSTKVDVAEVPVVISHIRVSRAALLSNVLDDFPCSENVLDHLRKSKSSPKPEAAKLQRRRIPKKFVSKCLHLGAIQSQSRIAELENSSWKTRSQDLHNNR